MTPLTMRKQLDMLPDDKRGQLWSAAMGYVEDGISPDFTDPLLALVWAGYVVELDKDGVRWDSKNLQRQYAVFCREAPKFGVPVVPFEAWKDDPEAFKAKLQTAKQRLISTDDRPMLTDNGRSREVSHTITNTNTSTITKSINNSLVTTPAGVGDEEKPKRAKKQREPFAHDSKPYKCAAFLSEAIAKRRPSGKNPTEQTLQSWADDFDKCHRLDAHPWEEISAVLGWCQGDDFWQDNILSGGKFRKQYEQLLVKAAKKGAFDE